MAGNPRLYYLAIAVLIENLLHQECASDKEREVFKEGGVLQGGTSDVMQRMGPQ